MIDYNGLDKMASGYAKITRIRFVHELGRRRRSSSLAVSDPTQADAGGTVRRSLLTLLYPHFLPLLIDGEDRAPSTAASDVDCSRLLW